MEKIPQEPVNGKIIDFSVHKIKGKPEMPLSRVSRGTLKKILSIATRAKELSLEEISDLIDYFNALLTRLTKEKHDKMLEEIKAGKIIKFKRKNISKYNHKKRKNNKGNQHKKCA